MSYPQSYTTPSAPPAPQPEPGVAYPYQQPSTQPNNYYGTSQNPSGNYGSPSFNGSYSHYPPLAPVVVFPARTSPEVIRSFEMVDRDRSGFVDEKELQEALSSWYRRFSLRTIRLLMFLFKHPTDSLRIGPKEFAELWNCLSEWQVMFERFDRDRSGKIDAMELRDALYRLGYAIPPSVLQVLISRYDDRSGQKVELTFDSFVECGMIVKGLTEKFKEKDTRYTGSATLTYDTFMAMIIPFLVS